jgi:hypothetical protein
MVLGIMVNYDVVTRIVKKIMMSLKKKKDLENVPQEVSISMYLVLNTCLACRAVLYFRVVPHTCTVWYNPPGRAGKP